MGEAGLKGGPMEEAGSDRAMGEEMGVDDGGDEAR